MHKARNLVLVSLILVIGVPAIARAQEAGSGGAMVGGPYDPTQDFVSPGLARWLYYGEVFAYAPLWSGAVARTFGFGFQNDKDVKYDEAIELIGWPGTFFGFLWATRHTEITMGMVDASSWGSLQGAGAGWLLGDMLVGWGQREGGLNPRYATTLGLSVAGHILGFKQAQSREMNWGNSEMLAQSGLLGATYGALLFSLPVPMSDNFWYGSGVAWSRKVVEFGTVAGWAAGICSWHRYAPLNYTTGDAISSWDVLATSVLSGCAVANLFTDDLIDDKPARTVAGLVNGAGVAYGYWFHRNRDVGLGQSVLVTMGTVVGAVGLGGATGLVSTGKAGWVAAAVGGWAGFHLSHALLGTGEAAQASHTRSDGFLSRVQVMPANAISVLLAAKTGGSVRAPLVYATF
jgi:hypothetical protein